MRRTALLVAAFGTAPSSASGSASSCAARPLTAGRCLKPILSQDDDAAPALGLIQKALWSKARETRLGEVVVNSTTLPLCGEDVAELGPLPLGYRSEVEVFRQLGLVAGRAKRCAPPAEAPSLLSYFAGHTIEERNKVALIVAGVWFAVLTTLIAWSVAAVLVVPRKREWENHALPRQLHLADEDEAFKKGWIHWMSLSWVDGLMGRYGKCLHAVVNDAEIVENRNDEEYLPYLTFKRHWKEQIELKGIDNASIPMALFKTVGVKATACLVAAVALELLFSLVGLVIALDKFLKYLEVLAASYEAHPDRPVDLLHPTVIIIAMLFGVPLCFRASSIVAALLDGYYCNMCASGLASIVFEKALLLPIGEAPADEDLEGKGALDADNAEANRKPNVIQILNVDIIELWGSLLKQLLQCMMAPMIALILFVMLVQQLKLAGLIGFLYTIPCMTLTICAQMVMITFWKRYQGFQDIRLQNLTETILHIRTIKSLAWESLSFKRLNDARLAELACNQKTITTGGAVLSLLHTTPWFSMLIALYVLLRTQGEIRAHQIIVVQRLMMSLLAALGLIQLGVRKSAQAPNSFRRIRTYLAQQERPEGVVREPPAALPGAPPPPALRARGSFTFVEGKPPVLHALDVSIPRGELVAVIGEVASGKSSFLQTLIGELHAIGHGFVEAPSGGNRVAYCSQVPWIFEGTLKDNIVMRSSFDEERYHEALRAAALTSDLQILPGGDQVTIGSLGVRLSGGQRARVALARAAYTKLAEVLIIDDPFASVDVPTGQHLLEELLLGPLTRGKTRIVVTQPSAKLRRFDRVILLRDGRVVADAPPADVMGTSEYSRLLAAEDESSRATPSVATGAAGGCGGQQRPKSLAVRAPEPMEATSLREVEAQEHVTWSTIRWWMQAAGYSNLAFFIGMCISQRILMLRESLSLATWIDVKTTQASCDDHEFMVVVAGYVLMTIVSISVAAYAASRVSISASTKMHETVVRAILRAPIDRFFDKHPVGRLINRLSFDMRQVDDYIPLACVMLFMFCFGFCVNQSFIVGVMPSRVVAIAVPFYFAVFVFIFLYRGTCVPLVFHSKFALSSLQDMQAVVLSTAVSIRANNMFDDFMMRYNHQSASIIRCQYLIHYVCKAWVQSRVFLTFCTITTIFALGGLWTRMPMGTLATVLTLLFEQMVEFENISTVFTQFLNILNALQRLTNYFRIPQEAAETMPGDPVVRMRASIDRAAVPRLEIQGGTEAEEACLIKGAPQPVKPGSVVVCHNGVPVLRATEDNLALELVPGIRLLDLFPSCSELRALQGGAPMYHIVAVNSVAKDAGRMAEELCSPPATVWLDFWCSAYASGMRVALEDLAAGYGKDKSVLDMVRVDIPARCKVGFAGKTGCGKSTTLLCILRILEPRSGRILIGDIDTSRIGLNTLRAMVGLVPQDPTIFQGTWRYNIDPFGEFPDGRIWEALRCVQLLPYIRTLPNGIDSEITRDGANISFGQRQLLSLARMVVRQPPVLLLDECTSALDPSTQQAAQSTLLHDFPMSTVVAIAHRVETILDFDRIVVFDRGAVAEQGTVKEVMSIENGLFRAMVEGAQGVKVESAAEN